MELKRDIASIISCGDTLLIVPYGIETRITGKPCDNWRLLLIVPYGIETRQPGKPFGEDENLLIVPYGIETSKLAVRTSLFALLIVPYGIETVVIVFFVVKKKLLIVPYGIETLNQSARFRYLGTFNRTLWNWNIILLIWYMMTLTFNRTLWNWNSLPAQCLNNPFSFNRTLWNWNFCRGRLACGKTRLLIVPYGIETKKTTLFQLCFTCF